MTLCPTFFGNTQSHFIWLYETGYDAKTITFDLLTHCKKFKCSKNMHFKKMKTKSWFAIISISIIQLVKQYIKAFGHK